MQMNQNELTDLLNKLKQEIIESNKKQLEDFFNKLVEIQDNSDKALMEAIRETIKETIDKNMQGFTKKIIDKILEDLIKINNKDNDLIEKIISISKENGTFIKENELLRSEANILKVKLQNKSLYSGKELDELADALDKIFKHKREV